MRKITFIIVLLAFCASIFAQERAAQRASIMDAMTIAEEIKLNPFNLENDKGLEPIFNFDPETATLTVYGFGPDVWGYWTGHNEYGWGLFAEKFEIVAPGDLLGFAYAPMVVHGANSVTFRVWSDDGGAPGTELASEVVDYADIVVQDFNQFQFTNPVAVGDVFYVGYEINYTTPVDTFAMVQTQASPANTFYFNFNNDWTDMPTATGNPAIATSLAIGVLVDINLDSPFGVVNPSSWNAGQVEVGGSATSPTITLTNSGAGTLTVSNATALSGPWSTTFVAGDVSLDAGDSYTFTFGFNPTAEGTFNESFVITTNENTVTVNLSGTCTAAITGDMDGSFETNVNDFDLDFAGWVQHDLDGSPTYGFQGVTFPNTGYTGSFIAFNPSATTPPLEGPEIAPHTGQRFGACIAAVEGPNDDWLITPQSDVIQPGAVLRFYVKTYMDDWGLERYTVNISTTGTAVGDFTKISEGNYLTAPVDAWTLVEYPLDAYVGSQIYAAIQCVTDDAFIFMVDDIEIDNPVSALEVNELSTVVFPNPATDIINVFYAENSSIYVMNMLGEVIYTVENANANQTIDISSFAAGTYFVRVDSEVFKISVVK